MVLTKTEILRISLGANTVFYKLAKRATVLIARDPAGKENGLTFAIEGN